MFARGVFVGVNATGRLPTKATTNTSSNTVANTRNGTNGCLTARAIGIRGASGACSFSGPGTCCDNANPSPNTDPMVQKNGVPDMRSELRPSGQYFRLLFHIVLDKGQCFGEDLRAIVIEHNDMVRSLQNDELLLLRAGQAIQNVPIA